MEHELRAEYVDGGSPGAAVKTWHVVRLEATTAMCGRELLPAAEVRSTDEWGTPGLALCHSCGALYLREAP
ncbi:hypothetical protein [Streptomyces sp. NPDC051162]|uniref:hypothetical protein n=1 Tax=unclassified Streptomyces TaxID=2593676 RepID=UPI00342F27E6